MEEKCIFAMFKTVKILMCIDFIKGLPHGHVIKQLQLKLGERVYTEAGELDQLHQLLAVKVQDQCLMSITLQLHPPSHC